MSPAKSTLLGLAVGLIAYFVVGNVGAILPFRGATTASLSDTDVAPSLAPSATMVPNRGTKYGTNSSVGAKVVAPSMAPSATTVAPSPVVSVTPRISAPTTPTPTPTPTATTSVAPRISVAPTPTPTPTPTAISTPTPTPSPTPTATPTPTPSTVPTSGTSRVVINEVAWAGTAKSAADEWVELYNAGDSAVDLSGWTLHGDADTKGNTLIIALSGSIAPGAYYLIERTDDTPVDGITADLTGPFGGSGLKNAPGENLMLRDAGGVAVDSVPCATGWFGGSADPDYASMERISAAGSGAEPSNWATNTGLVTTGSDAAGAPIRGTPKYKNSVTP